MVREDGPASGTGTGPRPCHAAASAIARARDASWCLVTRIGKLYVCDLHLRLLELKLTREQLEPRVETLAGTAA